MEDWSYKIREWWAAHRRNILRYGFCGLGCIAGLKRGAWLLVWLSLGAAAIMHCYDRFNGEYWRQRGAGVLGAGKKKDAP